VVELAATAEPVVLVVPLVEVPLATAAQVGTAAAAAAAAAARPR
jgi:hypothetical protein